MRCFLAIAAAALAGCSSASAPKQPEPDATAQPWYGDAVRQLESMNGKARELLARHKSDEAARVITAAEAWANRVIGVPHPTLAAMEAASELDEMYGRMLLENRNYGWARMMFQKNLARWRTWQPRTGETLEHLKTAEQEIAECDRRMTE
ncbi:MAG TPA: hypothetical protein VKV17_08105 [Bryobacteraceae bacterium]|nr:hypothetical protein [Bryobacteraceae bacterium]